MADKNTVYMSEKQKVKEITDKLEAGLKELFESEKYKSYLSTMSKFHNYSFNNTLLIAIFGVEKETWNKALKQQTKITLILMDEQEREYTYPYPVVAVDIEEMGGGEIRGSADDLVDILFPVSRSGCGGEPAA